MSHVGSQGAQRIFLTVKHDTCAYNALKKSDTSVGLHICGKCHATDLVALALPLTAMTSTQSFLQVISQVSDILIILQETIVTVPLASVEVSSLGTRVSV